MNLPLLNLLRTSKVFAVVLGLHLFILSLLLFHPGCQHTPAAESTAPMGEVTALDNATLSEPTRPTDTVAGTSTPSAAVNDTSIAATPAIDSSVSAAAPVEAPEQASYTVVKGDSFWSIAHKSGVTVNALLEANSLTKNSIIKPGQTLKVPAAAATSTTTVAPAEAISTVAVHTTYKVKAGDSLAKIAKHNAVSVRALKSANHLSSDTIRVGQKLTIPAKGEAAAVAAPAAETSAPVVEPSAAATSSTEALSAPAATESAEATEYATHKVVSGESPAVIAKKYGMKTSELLSINSITDPRKLKIGQELKVKASAASAASATSTAAAPSVEALDAMTSDKAADAAPTVEVRPAAELK